MRARTVEILRGLSATIRQSLRSEEQDYTQGSVPRAIILLAIPMILELSLESVFAVVDMFFVGRLGRNAIATVGLTESVITIVYSLSFGLSTAATAIVARRIGEGNHEGAAHAGAQSFLVAFVASVLLSAAGIVFGGDILSLMGANEEVVRDGAIFTRIMFGGSLAIILLFLINGIFRGAGDPAMAMKSLWIASGVNIVLCPLFIHLFGLKGAAIATVAGRSSGVLFQLYHLARGSGLLKLRARHFTFDPDVVRSMFSLSWPAALQFIISSGSWIVIVRLVAETGGTSASAGCQIALRSFLFFILPAWGLSNAGATLVGQNLGARHPERAEESVLLIAKYNSIIMGLVTLLFLFFSNPIVRLFSEDEAVIQYGTQSLEIFGSGFIIYGIAMVMTQALNGAGDTRTPTVINFVCFWLIEIPLAYVLSEPLQMKSAGALAAIPLAESILAFVMWRFFRRGKWKAIEI
ncbi:MAG TPA: MATE family efflux transporter [Bacteroidota bacterium]|nr:MATE family efflux transporter [Bacteroidota bacterium]